MPVVIIIIIIRWLYYITPLVPFYFVCVKCQTVKLNSFNIAITGSQNAIAWNSSPKL